MKVKASEGGLAAQLGEEGVGVRPDLGREQVQAH